MSKKTTNTENTPKPEWLFGGNPNAIEAQEARGQEELINSLQLPKKCNYPRGTNAVEQYHKMGIKTFTSSKGDDLFIGVKLPDGWKKQATEHSMWNNLLDDKGRVRATFFYKAAFYDRDAFVNFQTRYQRQCKHYDNTYTYCVVDTASRNTLFESERLDSKNINDDYFKNQELCTKQCEDYLNENFAYHEDINAYWD